MQNLSPPPSLLKVSMAPEGPCLFVELRGELDLCSVRDLPGDDYSSRPDLTMVLVDLGGLTFCDLTGLRGLMRFRRMHEAQGRTVAVVRATPFVWRLLRLCGMSGRNQTDRPVEAAV